MTTDTEELPEDSATSHSFDESYESGPAESGHSSEGLDAEQVTAVDPAGYGGFEEDSQGGQSAWDSVDVHSTTDPSDDIVGDPGAAEAYWFEQAENGWCGPASVSEVIAEATGSTNLEAIELEVVARAEELGYLSHTGNDFTTGWSGMQPADIATLLQSFGVPAAEGTGTISDLEQALSNGDQVIAAVDSSTIWNAEGMENVTDPGQADHALVVTGIDEKNGIVYLNDPGRPEGGATHISLDVFEKAWQASGNTLVVADASGAGQDTTQADTTQPDGGTAETTDPTITSDPTQDPQTGYETPGDTSTAFDAVIAADGPKAWILPITLTSPHAA